MGFRFRKTIKLAPGIRLNLSGRGASVSFGPRGLRYTVGPKGKRLTVGLPGSGLSVTHYTPYTKGSSHASNAVAPDISAKPPIREGHPPQPFMGASETSVDNRSTPDLPPFSTLELEPILNRVTRRPRLTPTALTLSAVLVGIVTLQQAAAIWVILYAAAILPIFVLLDRYRRSVRIHYNLSDDTKIISESLAKALASLRRCDSIWLIQSEIDTHDLKRNAGAARAIQRQKIALSSGRPDCIRGNADLPQLPVGSKESLFFAPDALLLVNNTAIRVLSYSSVFVSVTTARFVEEDPLPADAQIIDQTWRYVNKNGGPDRRFSFNKQLPVCLYAHVTVEAEGLKKTLQCSNIDAATSFTKIINVICDYGHHISQSRPIVSIETPKAWPTAAVSLSAVIFGAFSIVMASAVSPISPAGTLRPSAPLNSAIPLPPQRPKNLTQTVATPASQPAFLSSISPIAKKRAIDSPQRRVPLPRSRPAAD